MYLTTIEVENIRSIRHLSWRMDEQAAPGWHVIIGNNGAGKSSLLRAAALALVGPEDVHGLRQAGDDWLRRGTDAGSVGVVFTRDDDFDRLAGPGAPSKEYGAYVQLKRVEGGVTLGVDLGRAVRGKAAERSIWAPESRGWFSAGFGPYRRFTGGEGDSRKLASSLPRLARYLSLFDEQFALIDALEWIANLKFAALSDNSTLFDQVKRFVNQEGFLPHGVRLDDVTAQPKLVNFIDGAGARVPVQELSDGFRSILSLTLELLRQLVVAFGEDRVFDRSAPERIAVPGVVLIDEVDVHLHPTWQRGIGAWLTRAFPRMQFLVTTHSPLICQNAERGSVFLLPELGAAEEGRFLDENEKRRLVFGNVLDAYGTGAFGARVAQSDAGREHLERLAELNAQELDDSLSDEERSEREALRAMLPSQSASLPRRGA